MKQIVLISLLISSILLAGGYKIPETSTNAVALGAANVAHNQNNADAAYYNPAKMVFMSDENHLEADLNYIGLDSIKYKSTSGNEIQSEKEDFYVPELHYVSSQLGTHGVRVGMSVVAPAGLSKRWNDAPASTTAKEFTLETVEVNPTVAFKINEKTAFAIGFRAVHSKAKMKNVYFDMTGNGLDFAYNLAVAYNPTKELEIGVTYRSKVNLNLNGTTSRFYTPALMSDVSVNIPVPATLNVAFAYTFPMKTTLEIDYERMYWSAYKNLDFNFVNPTTENIFGIAKPKNWKDTNTFRFGLTQVLEKVTLMAGLVIDETPVPAKTLGFELPDTNSVAISLGGRYKINDKIDLGLSALYSMHEKRTVSASVNDNLIDGEFAEGDVLLISVGLGYKF